MNLFNTLILINAIILEAIKKQGLMREIAFSETFLQIFTAISGKLSKFEFDLSRWSHLADVLFMKLVNVN